MVRSPGGDARSAEWLARSERHMELVGATQDARSIRVRLDVQLALAGDAEAERRLRETAASGQAEEIGRRAGAARAGPRSPGSASGTTRRSPTPTTVIRGLAGLAGPPPQPRVMLRVAAAVMHLRVAEVRPAAGRDADAQAAALLAARPGRGADPHGTCR